LRALSLMVLAACPVAVRATRVRARSGGLTRRRPAQEGHAMFAGHCGAGLGAKAALAR